MGDSETAALARVTSDRETAAPAQAECGSELDVAERYAVQFTATEEYVRLVEQAKALLSHTANRSAKEVRRRPSEYAR